MESFLQLVMILIAIPGQRQRLCIPASIRKERRKNLSVQTWVVRRCPAFRTANSETDQVGSAFRTDDSQENDREFLRDFRIGALVRSKIHPVLLQQQRRDQVHQKVQMRRTFFADWDSAEGKGVHVDGQKEPHI